MLECPNCLSPQPKDVYQERYAEEGPPLEDGVIDQRSFLNAKANIDGFFRGFAKT